MGFKIREMVVWLIIALHLFTTLSTSAVLAKLARGLRFIWPDPSIRLPRASAISYRRSQLGARPLVALFQLVCQPLATLHTRGAFLFGLRLMAIDGVVEDVPDTPANAAYFGRHTSARGAGAFPQVQGVLLVECGTHSLMLASGPATPVNVLAACVCCALWSAGCWSCGTVVFTTST